MNAFDTSILHLSLLESILTIFLPLFQPPKCTLGSETTRNLLICLLWLFKNLDDLTVRAALAELSYARLQQLMDVFYIATSCFEYLVSSSDIPKLESWNEVYYLQ